VVRGLTGRVPKVLGKKTENPDPDWRPDDAMPEAYGRWQDLLDAIENNHSQSRDISLTLLCWLAHAESPMTLDDLAKALSWDVISRPECRVSWREDGGIEIDGVDINAAATCGMTPLHSAVYQGSVETLQVLLDHGVNPPFEQKTARRRWWPPVALRSRTRLMSCWTISSKILVTSTWTARQYYTMQRQLLHLAIDPSISSRRGGTALHLAAHKGNVDMVMLLLLDSTARVDTGYEFSGTGLCQRRSFAVSAVRI
jgi:hypothetical protein